MSSVVPVNGGAFFQHHRFDRGRDTRRHLGDRRRHFLKGQRAEHGMRIQHLFHLLVRLGGCVPRESEADGERQREREGDNETPACGRWVELMRAIRKTLAE